MLYRIFARFIAITVLVPFVAKAENELTPFPYDYAPISTISVRHAEPLLLDLSDYFYNLSPDLVKNISYPFQDQNVIVFQSPQNPLNIAITFQETLKGYNIFPLLIEFREGVKSPFFIATENLSSQKTNGVKAPQSRLFPFQKRIDKAKGTHECVFYFYDPENREEARIDKVQVMLGNERIIHNFGTQDLSIFIPLPEGEFSEKPLRIFAKSKNGTWARECVVWDAQGKTGEGAEWRNAVSYLVSGRKRDENAVLPDATARKDSLTFHQLDANESSVLEQKTRNGYFEKLFINVLLCPKQKQSPEWLKLIETAGKNNTQILLYSGDSLSLRPIDKPDFKRDTLWNPVLTEKIHDVFGRRTKTITELHGFVTKFSEESADKLIIPAIALNLPGKPRLIDLIEEPSQPTKDYEGDDSLKYQRHEMALGYLMTFSGVPILLYGDETGSSGEGLERLNDDLSREQKAFLKRITQIMEARKTSSALSSGAELTLVSEERVLAFLKIYFGETILCVFNLSSDPETREIALPAPFHKTQKIKPLLKKGKGEITGNVMRIDLPPCSFEYFSLEL